MDNLDKEYKSKNPFTVPDHYFDQLTDRVMERVKKEENEVKKTSFLQMIKPYLGLAALFVLAMIVVQLLVPKVAREKNVLEQSSGESRVLTQSEEEHVFDADFNPSQEEIIEYLSQETDPMEFLFAERR